MNSLVICFYEVLGYEKSSHVNKFVFYHSQCLDNIPSCLLDTVFSQSIYVDV